MKLDKRLIVSIILCLFSIVIYGHSGRTDCQGGHYDHKHGGYHYHHGLPAHNHPNGVCEYNKWADIALYVLIGIGCIFIGYIVIGLLTFVYEVVRDKINNRNNNNT